MGWDRDPDGVSAAIVPEAERGDRGPAVPITAWGAPIQLRRAHDLTALQTTIGNAAVTRLVASHRRHLQRSCCASCAAGLPCEDEEEEQDLLAPVTLLRNAVLARQVLQTGTAEYQRGYADGAACAEPHPGPLLPDALDDYNRGYGDGKQNCRPGPVAPVPAPAGACAQQFTKAGSFNELISLVQAAETKLAAAGITAPKDQVHALRGIYYGTAWSLDFSVEKSATRNEGFQRFTRPSENPATSVPRDVRPILDCHLFEALQDSQDMIDPGGRKVDFGHLLIGLDARYDPAMSKSITYPVPIPVIGGTYDVDLGGTGLELVTWLGDLGGGAASLSIKRAAAPKTSASTVFTGSDYGGSINLEGDVAASVVASGGAGAVTAPTLSASTPLSDALKAYLLPGSATKAWDNRATSFLTMNGATVDASGALTNRAALITAFATKIQTFACNYLASRVKDKHVTLGVATTAGTHVIGAANEVATAFVDALDDSHKSGGAIEATRFPAPTPPGSQACGSQLAAGKVGGLLGGL